MAQVGPSQKRGESAGRDPGSEPLPGRSPCNRGVKLGPVTWPEVTVAGGAPPGCSRPLKSELGDRKRAELVSLAPSLPPSHYGAGFNREKTIGDSSTSPGGRHSCCPHQESAYYEIINEINIKTFLMLLLL